MLHNTNNDLKAYSEDADQHIHDHHLEHNQKYFPAILTFAAIYHLIHAFAFNTNLFDIRAFLPSYYFGLELFWGILLLCLGQIISRVHIRQVRWMAGVSIGSIYVSMLFQLYLYNFIQLPFIMLLGVVTILNLIIYDRLLHLLITSIVFSSYMILTGSSFTSLDQMLEAHMLLAVWLVVSLFINSIITRNYTQNLIRDHHLRIKSDELEKRQQALEHRHMDVQRNRQFLSTILRQLSTAVAIFDKNGRVIDANEPMRLYFAKLFDFDTDDENVLTIRHHMNEVSLRATGANFEISQNNKIFNMKISKVQGESHASPSILVEATDITALKMQQVELRKVLKVRDILITINNLITKEAGLDTYFDYILEQLVDIFDHGELACVLLMDEDHILRPSFTYGYDESDIPNFAIELETSFMYKQVGHVPNRTVILKNIQEDLGEGCPPLLATDDSFVIRTSLCTPIIVNDKLYGLLNIDSSIEDGFTDDDITIMEYFREHLASVVANQAIMRHTIHLSKCDPLTNLYNRWVLDEIKMEEYDRWMHNDVHVSIIMIDLNSLKQINDTYGHDAGDEYITVLANALRTTFRKNDLLLRTGGDEFLCILPSCSYEKANEKAMKANKLFIEECHGRFGNYDFGFSYGIAISPADSTDFDELIKIADTRMYVAKNNYRARQ